MSESDVNNVNIDNEKQSISTDTKHRLKAGIYLSSITLIAGVFAFGMTLASAKRKDPKMFQRGTEITKDLPETGVTLALRALKWGSIYAVSGCSALFYGIWKLSGASTMEEFRNKMGSILPRIPKNEVPQSRVEFEGLNELLTYLADEYGKEPKKESKEK